jgi:hypothetical protein
MAYIKFKRNQTNEATEMLLNVDNIVTILSTGVTNLTIKTALVTKDDEILVYTLQVAALAGVTLTRPSIVQSVIDTIQLAGTDGGNAPTVPTLEVQSGGIAGGAA